MTRWGFISTANINRKLIPGARDSPRVDLVGVASRDQQRVTGLEGGPEDRQLAGGLHRYPLGDLVGHHRLVGLGRYVPLQAARHEVEPRGVLPAPRQRHPQVQGLDLAHELAVLMPGAAHRRLGLPERGLVAGDERRLAEIVLHQLRKSRFPQHLARVEAEHRGVHGQHPAARLDEVAGRPDPSPGIVLERDVVAIVERPSGVVALPFRERALDLARDVLRTPWVEQTPHEHAAAAQDPGPEHPRAQLPRPDLR